MEIFCNQKEFAALVRQCQMSRQRIEVCGCVFAPVCSQGSDFTDENDVMVTIEDICEVLPGG